MSLSSETVNHYIRKDMASTAPLSRGYEGIVPKAVFKMLVLAVESCIQIKQINCKVIVRKQLVVIVNVLCDIISGNCLTENIFERVMSLTEVSLDVTITPAIKERRFIGTTYDNNLHTWFMSFRAFLLQYGFAMLRSDGDIFSCPGCPVAYST